MTDTIKCLQILKDRGDKGVHSFHLNKLIGTTRSAARIQDLEDQGYTITATLEKMGDTWGKRYTLVTGDSKKIEKTEKIEYYMKDGRAYAKFI